MLMTFHSKRMTAQKEKSVRDLKEDTWTIFSKYIRRRDCLKTTGNILWGLCFTCGKRFYVKELEAGHFLAGRGNAILFDERGCHAQCNQCNQFLHGNPDVYKEKMLKVYGKEVVEELERLKGTTRKFTRDELIGMIDDYVYKYKQLAEAKVVLKPGSYEYEIEANYLKVSKYLYR